MQVIEILWKFNQKRKKKLSLDFSPDSPFNNSPKFKPRELDSAIPLVQMNKKQFVSTLLELLEENHHE